MIRVLSVMFILLSVANPSIASDRDHDSSTSSIHVETVDSEEIQRQIDTISAGNKHLEQQLVQLIQQISELKQENRERKQQLEQNAQQMNRLEQLLLALMQRK